VDIRQMEHGPLWIGKCEVRRPDSAHIAAWLAGSKRHIMNYWNGLAVTAAAARRWRDHISRFLLPWPYLYPMTFI